MFVEVCSGPFRKYKSIKFGIIEKFNGSVNEPGTGGGGGKGGALITSKLTVGGFALW
jgi:hypothetical protein